MRVDHKISTTAINLDTLSRMGEQRLIDSWVDKNIKTNAHVITLLKQILGKLCLQPDLIIKNDRSDPKTIIENKDTK